MPTAAVAFLVLRVSMCAFSTPHRRRNVGSRHCFQPLLHSSKCFLDAFAVRIPADSFQDPYRRRTVYVFSHRRTSCSTVSRSQALPAARGPSSTAALDTACASPRRSAGSRSGSWRCRSPSDAPSPGLWSAAPPRRRTGKPSSVPPASLEDRRVRQTHPPADVGGE